MVSPSAMPSGAGSARLQVLARLAESLAPASGMPAAALLLARELAPLADFDHLAIGIRAADGRTWAVVLPRGGAEAEPGWQVVSDPASPLLAAAAQNVPVRVERAPARVPAGPPTPDALSALPSAVCLPVRGSDGAIGAFGLFAARPGTCAAADQPLLQVVAALLEATARRLVLIDDVGRLQREIERVERGRVDVAAMLVNDLRGPLASLDSGLDFLDQVLLPPEADEPRAFVRELRLAATHLGDLAANLLDVARLDETQARADLRTVALGPWLQEFAVRHAHAANVGDIKLTVRCDPPDATAVFDPQLMSRAVDNLLVNSLRNTPRRGQVTLVARRGGDGLVLAVADTGPAVSDEDRERLFSREGAVQLGGRLSRGGRGLGFFLCKLVVDLHGGRVGVEDPPGGGALFRITLP